MKTILIVRGEKQHGRCMITYLAERWELMGLRVITHHGPNDLPPADVAILHVDKSVVPKAYYDALAEYPVVVNRNILDISRERYSQILLTADSSYDGAVIVKTNANFGGIPDQKPSKVMRRLPIFRWSTRKYLYPLRYPIFKSLRAVPRKAWENPNLIVEKFCPETDGNHFFVRYWSFFGDSSITGRFGAKNPIVKFLNAATEDIPVEVPSDLVEKRRELGIDYGRFDFVIHGNRTILLDVNKTLGAGRGLEHYSDFLDRLARGIDGFLAHAETLRTTSTHSGQITAHEAGQVRPLIG